MKNKQYQLLNYGELILTNTFPNIVGYLFNNDLIDLPDEYWIEEDNGWKSTYFKDYKKIFKDFNELVEIGYAIVEVSHE